MVISIGCVFLEFCGLYTGSKGMLHVISWIGEKFSPIYFPFTYSISKNISKTLGGVKGITPSTKV
jgi:hypothetical protein